MSKTSRICMLLMPVMAFACGCSGATNPNAPATLSGSVTYKGSPVTGGIIAFHTEGMGTISRPIDANGNFTATDLPIGEIKVTVDTEPLNPARKTQTYAGRGGGKKMTMSPTPEGASTGPVGTYVRIPAKYGTPATTDLKVNLVPGNNTATLELKD